MRAGCTRAGLLPHCSWGLAWVTSAGELYQRSLRTKRCHLLANWRMPWPHFPLCCRQAGHYNGGGVPLSLFFPFYEEPSS